MTIRLCVLLIVGLSEGLFVSEAAQAAAVTIRASPKNVVAACGEAHPQGCTGAKCGKDAVTKCDYKCTDGKCTVTINETNHVGRKPPTGAPSKM